MHKVRFKKRVYVLAGDLATGGAIATRHEYRHGLCSFAYLHADGAIKQYGKQIGTRDDLTVLGTCDIKPAADSLETMLSDRSGFPLLARMSATVDLIKRLHK